MHTRTHTHTHTHTLGATIGFDATEYDVIENEMFSNVTIRLTGTIAKDITFRVTTRDDSAVCKYTSLFFCYEFPKKFL